jgi:hypothetical protein
MLSCRRSADAKVDSAKQPGSEQASEKWFAVNTKAAGKQASSKSSSSNGRVSQGKAVSRALLLFLHSRDGRALHVQWTRTDGAHVLRSALSISFKCESNKRAERWRTRSLVPGFDDAQQGVISEAEGSALAILLMPVPSTVVVTVTTIEWAKSGRPCRCPSEPVTDCRDEARRIKLLSDE